MSHAALRKARHSLIVALVVALLRAGMPLPAAAQGTVLADRRFDLSHNQLINAVDIDLLAQRWATLQEDAGCSAAGFASRDLNHDGCIDVADAQQLATQIGSATDVQAPQLAPAVVLTSAIFTVTTNLSDEDSAPGDGQCLTGAASPSAGKCTLRAALQEASIRPGPERIEFNIRNADGSCPGTVTIRPANNQPDFFVIEDMSAGVTVDGYTQCGARPNTSSAGGNAVLKVQVDGRYTSGGKLVVAPLDIDGIKINSPNNIIRGLAVYGWDHNILISGSQAKYNRIEGNFIGTDVGQSYVNTTSKTHHYEGLRIRYGASYNVIGCGVFSAGTTFTPCSDPAQAAAARNIISGNGNDGLHIEGDGSRAHDNHIIGNLIGLKQNGTTALRNQSDAIDFEQGVYANWLGGETTLERNIIGGNGSEGIEISHNTMTQFNRVAGNYFGIDITGTKAVPNNGNGISFEDTVDTNYAYNNVVAGNNGNGIRFYVLATHNEVYNNLIGFGADRVTPIKNGVPGNAWGEDGVYVMGGSQYNKIYNNIIANHNANGVEVDPQSDSDHGYAAPTSYNTISRNSIYNNGKLGIFLDSKTNSDTNIKYYANDRLAAPKILRAGTDYVVGTACPNCTIEVFIAAPTNTFTTTVDTAGEGKTFLGSAISNYAGQFNVPVSGVAQGELVTATATDSQANTSQFATNVTVGSSPVATLTPGPTLTPTADTGATATAVAATGTAYAATSEAHIATSTAQALETEQAEVSATALAMTAEAQHATATSDAATATAGAATATAAARATGTAAAATATSAAATAAVAGTQTAAAAIATAQAEAITSTAVAQSAATASAVAATSQAQNATAAAVTAQAAQTATANATATARVPTSTPTVTATPTPRPGPAAGSFHVTLPLIAK